MTKRNIFTIILNSVFIIIFNVLFFLHGGLHSVAQIWICYGFLHFAYLMVLITPLIELKGKTASFSRLTTYLISFLYFIADLVFTALICFYRDSDGLIRFGVVPVVSVEIIVTALYVVILVVNLLTNDTIAQKQAKHDAENGFIKAISAKTKYIEALANEHNLKGRLNDLYATVHTSPIRSSSEVTIYEEKIMGLLDELEKNVEQNKAEKSAELITEIGRLLNKRNLMIKMRQM